MAEYFCVKTKYGVRFLRKLLLAVLLFLLLLPSQVLAKPVVAVMSFEGAEVRDWYLDREQMIKGITESLTDYLADLDEISVVERARLDQIMEEQDFGQSGRVDTLSAVEIGRLLGADLLILGTVHGLELKESAGIQIGRFGAKGTSAKVDLSMRIVDVKTGVILGSLQAASSKTGASIGVKNLYGISFYSDTFKNSVLGKAIDEATQELVNEFSAQADNFKLETSDLAGSILAVVGDKYVLNLGAPHNVTS